MQVEKGDIVKAYIKAETEKGDIFFSNKNALPMEFKVEPNFFLKGIEHVITGMKEGDKKEMTLPPEETYGHKKKMMIKTIPRGFHTMKKECGEKITYFDYIKKAPLEGVIIEAQEKTLVVDFNNPLCGKSIIYNIEVLDITKPGQVAENRNFTNYPVNNEETNPGEKNQESENKPETNTQAVTGQTIAPE